MASQQQRKKEKEGKQLIRAPVSFSLFSSSTMALSIFNATTIGFIYSKRRE
jgi:hypothetical protein